MAIDVAILVPEDVGSRAREISRALAGDRADALRLDAAHLPHVTLAQQFVERARFDELFAEIDRLLRHEPPLLLRIHGITYDHDTAYFAVEATPDLQRLHEAVMDAIEPFESPDGSVRAFHHGPEAIRPEDADWVRNFREASAYAHFRPHVTLGHGEVTEPAEPLDFSAKRVAACHLGRFCTCRTVLREWKLQGS